MHIDSAAIPCPVCGIPMIRVTSHDQCPQCGFILPCCDGDAVLCADAIVERALNPETEPGQKSDTGTTNDTNA